MVKTEDMSLHATLQWNIKLQFIYSREMLVQDLFVKLWKVVSF